MTAVYDINELTPRQYTQLLVNDYCNRTGAMTVAFGVLVNLVYDNDMNFANDMMSYGIPMSEELRRGPVLIWSNNKEIQT